MTQTTISTQAGSSDGLGQWMAAAEQDAWLAAHMRLVEDYGYAARAMQSWLTTKDSNRDLVFPIMANRMEATLEAVRAHAERLARC